MDDIEGTVLVAEDDPTNRMFVEHLLLGGGHSATLVENGRQALEALKNGQYDLVLMDVQMPEVSGVEATRLIRTDESGELDPAIPIVALTAYAMKGDREKFLASGMDGYISKPVDPDAFQQTIADVLAHRKGPGASKE